MNKQQSADVDNHPLTTEEKLIQHSYDLVVFSRYLENLPPRVTIKLRDTDNNCDVYAVYVDASGHASYKYGQLIPDENGLHTSNNEIYTGIHDAFRLAMPTANYIGFRGCGRFPIAPLMQVAISYQRYGRGIFKDGESLPTPCLDIESQYGLEILSFRTNAPLK